MRIAMIGGTGVDEMEAVRSGHVTHVATPFGAVEAVEIALDGTELMFVPRHGLDHSVPPAQVNYRAQIACLKMAGVTRVVGVCAVGSLKRALPPGTFAVLGDFIDLTKRRLDTFFDELGRRCVHTDMSCPYCAEMSKALTDACIVEKAPVSESVTYVGVEGPRYETPAEIRLYASWGAHVIGMTNIPEVVLAREAGLCYGAIGVVSNLASGLSPTPLSHDEVRGTVRDTGETLIRILRRAIRSIPAERRCMCSANTGLVL